MKIVIVRAGYVGRSNGVLLAQNNEVVFLDINPEKVKMLNRKESIIEDEEIKDFLANKSLNFRATLDKVDAYNGAHFSSLQRPPTTTLRLTASILSPSKRLSKT